MPVSLRALCAALFTALLIAPTAQAQEPAPPPSLTGTVLAGAGVVTFFRADCAPPDISFGFGSSSGAVQGTGRRFSTSGQVAATNGLLTALTEDFTIDTGSVQSVTGTATFDQGRGSVGTASCDSAGRAATDASLLRYTATIQTDDGRLYTDSGTTNLQFLSGNSGFLTQSFVSDNGLFAKPVDADGDGVNDGVDQCKGTTEGTPVNAVGCADRPTTKDQCKNGGFRDFGTAFKNQGDCVSFVATHTKNPPAGGK